MDASAKTRKTIASSSTSLGSSSSTKGVQKLYSKIRHKIEDIPPKITAKLHRTSKVVPAQTTKPVAAPRTKRRQHLQQQQQNKQQIQEVQAKPFEQPKMEFTRQNSTPATYENIKISSNPFGYFDSDDECRMSVNDSALSLEDEIFEELEKVAHDEAKLNAVLKNFDKILADFNDRNAAATKSAAIDKPKSPQLDPEKSPKHEGFKQLQKSKTCSIIESRCILKKSISDSEDNLNQKLSHYRAYQITKSLWSLQDFEEFAKSGKNLERFECKLPIWHNSSLLKGIKTRPDTPPKNRNLLSKSKSVWELSTTSSPPTYNGCQRTSSGSKIPIKKPPLRLAAAGRSCSFIDPPTTMAKTPQKFGVQIGKVQPNLRGNIPTKVPSMKNLNEQSSITASRGSAAKSLSRTNSSMSSSSRGNTSINLIKKRSLTAALSTPHSLNKVGVASKIQVTKSNSASLATPTIKTSMKSAKSELSLRQPRYTKNHQTPNKDDIMLNKCLEKGQQILRKVEAFGSVTKIDKASGTKRDFISPSAVKAQQRSKDDTCISTNPQPQLSSQQNFTLIIVDKKKSRPIPPARTKNSTLPSSPQKPPSTPSTIIPVSSPPSPFQTPQVDADSLSYAAELVLKNPIVESCRIIPPILGDPSQQHAELMVNVKSQNSPIRIHQDAIMFANRITARSSSCEKEYQSDCSDDSGHISNENDEQYINIIQQFSSLTKTAISGKLQQQNNQKGKNKISELLEKFEKSSVKNDCVTTPIITSSLSSSSPSQIVVSPTSPSSRIHTTVKVAEIKPCIQSTVEIVPTYSNEVLFRSGVLNQLEAKRDELLSGRIVQLQAYCRGYLARRRVTQRRVQELAVRCIQRNVKAFLAVRDWPWWRLLVRVTPLLNVHRTEEQLKIANDELQSLRAKLDKSENDRNSLKTENDKLEAKYKFELMVDREWKVKW
ncbi:unnamed protein product [Hermetia illucens]|uniref:Uncharacterized protein n=1 Tax=Hermetia illucens TaxID=343691 RepID=A0A7R8Z248_HERIL|nr:unnamed protein product [Hermetia illucens]